MSNKRFSFMGVGINYRSEIRHDIVKHVDEIDFLEVYTEKFFDCPVEAELRWLQNNKPIICHGLDLSLGSDEALDPAYVNKLGVVLEMTNCPWFSDHIALTQHKAIEVAHLMPIPYRQKELDGLVEKICQLQAMTDKPFLLENIAFYYPHPLSVMSETEFISQIVERTGCCLLLDLNNLYINSVNQHYDPKAYLQAMPMDKTVEVHLAGSFYQSGLFIDTHAHPISEDVWGLFDWFCAHYQFSAVTIERDGNLKRFEDLLQEVQRARAILHKHGMF